MAQTDTNTAELISSGQVTDPHSAKGRLLAQAAHLFREKGYDRTTVRDIAREVGIQSGSIFHHFKSKEDILKAVMIEAILYNTMRMRAALADANTSKRRLLALIRCELESINGLTKEAMSVLVYEWRALSEENQREILKLRSVYENLWMETLSEAKKQSLIRGDTFIVRRLLAGALSWTTTWYKPDGDLTLDDLAAQVLLMISD